MHGDVSDPDHAVLTKDDYEGYFRDREPFVTALSGDLVSKTILFVGFSFTDPNIDYVMSRVRVVLRKQPKQHYCILRRETRRAREKSEHFDYRRRQQNYFVRDLSRIGIHALLVDEYSDITRILRAVEERFRQRTIFISGSAHEFGIWAADRAGELIEHISSSLVSAGMNIVTGFGLGVGPSVIAGALQVIRAHPRRYSENQIQAFPFPVEDRTGKDRAAMYTRYRQGMIAKCGIAVFLFGNKRNKKGRIVSADGVREEYQIAKALGLKIVAVGSTGWIAKEIANEMTSILGKRSKRFKGAFRIVNDPKFNNKRIVDALLTMIKEVRSA